jgi:hypothetical protein
MAFDDGPYICWLLGPDEVLECRHMLALISNSCQLVTITSVRDWEDHGIISSPRNDALINMFNCFFVCVKYAEKNRIRRWVLFEVLFDLQQVLMDSMPYTPPCRVSGSLVDETKHWSHI